MSEAAISHCSASLFERSDKELNKQELGAKTGFKVPKPSPIPVMYIPKGKNWADDEDDDFDTARFIATSDFSCPKIEDMPPLSRGAAEDDLPFKDTETSKDNETAENDMIVSKQIPTEAFASTIIATERYADEGVTIKTPNAPLFGSRPNPVFQDAESSRQLLSYIAIEKSVGLPAYEIMSQNLYTGIFYPEERTHYSARWSIMKASCGFDCRRTVQLVYSKLSQVVNADDSEAVPEDEQQDTIVRLNEELAHALEETNELLEYMEEEAKESKEEDWEEEFDAQHVQDLRSSMLNHEDGFSSSRDDDSAPLEEEQYISETYEQGLYHDEMSEVEELVHAKKSHDQALEAANLLEASLTEETHEHEVVVGSAEEEQLLLQGDLTTMDQILESVSNLFELEANDTSYGAHEQQDAPSDLEVLSQKELVDEDHHSGSSSEAPSSPELVADTGSDSTSENGHSSSESSGGLTTGVIVQGEYNSDEDIVQQLPLSTGSQFTLTLRPKIELPSAISPVISDEVEKVLTTSKAAILPHSSSLRASLAFRPKIESPKIITLATVEEVEEVITEPEARFITTSETIMEASSPSDKVEHLHPVASNMSLALRPRLQPFKMTPINTADKIDEVISTPEAPVKANPEQDLESSDPSAYLSELALHSWAYVSSNPWKVASALATGVVVVGGALHFARRR